MKYSIEEIAALVAAATRQKLARRELLEGFSFAELAEICNGIGPAAFPEWLSTALTRLHPTLEATAMIHDVEFSLSDGTRERFTEANARLRENGFKAAKYEYAWYDPRRYKVMFDAWRFARLCNRFGWEGWCSCAEANFHGGSFDE